MKGRIRNKNDESEKALGKNSWNGFEGGLPLNRAYADLFENISEYMKGRLDIEDVKNDPALSVTEDTVKKMVMDYNKNVAGNKKNEKFIRDVFSDEPSEKKIVDEISNIKQEADNDILKEITAEWVREWHEKRQKNNGIDPETEEIREFISDSLKPEINESEKSPDISRKEVFSRSLYLRYISLSAAAIIGAVFLVKALIPSDNPEKLFNSYYKPFNAVSPVTRSMNNVEEGSFASAIVSYRTGDYISAAAGFSEAALKDSSYVSPRFFLGLTQLALNNYDQAINLLSTIVNHPGEYGKEAQWYLGLAYLKTGNRSKASECFVHLAKSTGFYSERSEKILRRLK